MSRPTDACGLDADANSPINAQHENLVRMRYALGTHQVRIAAYRCPSSIYMQFKSTTITNRGGRGVRWRQVNHRFQHVSLHAGILSGSIRCHGATLGDGMQRAKCGLNSRRRYAAVVRLLAWGARDLGLGTTAGRKDRSRCRSLEITTSPSTLIRLGLHWLL